VKLYSFALGKVHFPLNLRRPKTLYVVVYLQITLLTKFSMTKNRCMDAYHHAHTYDSSEYSAMNNSIQIPQKDGSSSLCLCGGPFKALWHMNDILQVYGHSLFTLIWIIYIYIYKVSVRTAQKTLRTSQDFKAV